MKKIAVVNGPNLNFLGMRETDVYGSVTLQAVKENLISLAQNKAEIVFFQSNHEGEIIDFIHEVKTDQAYKGVIINPAAFTHTSIGIRDALLLLDLPIIEVHISNIYKREKFRHHSYISDIAEGSICGLGTYGYEAALKFLLD